MNIASRLSMLGLTDTYTCACKRSEVKTSRARFVLDGYPHKEIHANRCQSSLQLLLLGIGKPTHETTRETFAAEELKKAFSVNLFLYKSRREFQCTCCYDTTYLCYSVKDKRKG